MCRAITCDKCKRPTWAGCGAHVESVLGHVPEGERCKCRDRTASTPPGLGRAIRALLGR